MNIRRVRYLTLVLLTLLGVAAHIGFGQARRTGKVFTPVEHNGSVLTLEDWFDPRRLRDDYIPTGFRGAGVKTRAVKGHAYGLKLSAADLRALIAFLKTL